MEILTPDSSRWDDFAWALCCAVNPIRDNRVYRVCQHDYRFAEKIMTDMGCVDIPGSIAFFQDHGGHCDCEIFYNIDQARNTTDA